jgi:hypothetical protein
VARKGQAREREGKDMKAKIGLDTGVLLVVLNRTPEQEQEQDMDLDLWDPVDIARAVHGTARKGIEVEFPLTVDVKDGIVTVTDKNGKEVEL